MELQKDVMNSFIEYLHHHGYPEESMVTEYKISKNMRADLVVIDPITGIPIMIFELKAQKKGSFIKNGKNQIIRYLDNLPDSSIPAYLVFPKNNDLGFEVLRVNSDVNNAEQEEYISVDNINYNSHRIASLSEKAKKTEDKKIKTVDNLKRTSRLSAFLLTVVLISSKIFKIELSTVDLGLLGGIIVLILMPYINKLKLFGVEYERYNNAMKNN